MLKSIGAVGERPRGRRWLAAAAGLALGLTAALPAKAEETIKVGILHSLSGTMAISETTLKDVMLMLIEEQNKKGGVLGKKLEAVVVDPASNWPLFAEKARELISKDKVAVVFGCWTSVSRKSVLPVFKELNSILFYPVQYEGEESERNVFYTGAAPNQQAIPAVDYLMSADGGSVKRWVLEGTDYVYPRTTNKILEAYLKQKGVKDEDIMINYTPFGFCRLADRSLEDQGLRFGRQEDGGGLHHQRRRQRAVLQGARQPGHQGDRHSGRGVLGRRRRTRRSRHQAAGRPSRRLELLRVDQDAGERRLHQRVARLHQEPEAHHQRPDGSPLYRLQHVGEGGREGQARTDPDKVIDALPGTEAPNLTGGVSKMLPNHHITKPVFIGEIRPDGQFDVVWKTKDLVPGAAWSAYLPGSKDLEADWVKLKCGNYNTVTKKCGGAS